MEASRATVLPANKEHLKWYYTDRDALPAIRIIVESIYTDVLSYHSERFTEGNERLHTLRSERMAFQIESLKARLLKPKYQLDDVDSVLAVCGTNQMELVSVKDANPGPILSLTFLYLAFRVLDLSALVAAQENFGSCPNICAI